VEKVEVFPFRVYDPTKDEIIVPAFKSTRKRIEGDLIKGEIIPHMDRWSLFPTWTPKIGMTPTKGLGGPPLILAMMLRPLLTRLQSRVQAASLAFAE
jgi:hypothetical protein